MRSESVRTDSGDDCLNPVVSGVGVSHLHDHHDIHTHEFHEHDAHEGHGRVEAAPPSVPSRAVVINVGEHTGALVLASNEQRAGLEVEIHPVSHPGARTHVWVLPREGRDGVVYAAIFPNLESGDFAILGVDGSIADIISIPPNQVTHATWT